MQAAYKGCFEGRSSTRRLWFFPVFSDSFIHSSSRSYYLFFNYLSYYLDMGPVSPWKTLSDHRGVWMNFRLIAAESHQEWFLAVQTPLMEDLCGTRGSARGAFLEPGKGELTAILRAAIVGWWALRARGSVLPCPSRSSDPAKQS